VAGHARRDPVLRPRPAGSADDRRALAPLLPLFGLDVLTAFTVGMVPPLLPLVAAEWTLSPVQAGLVNTAYSVGRLLTAYPASRDRAHRGTRATILLGLAGLVAGSVGCGLASSFPLFLAGRLLMGLGASAAFLAVFAELLEVTPARWRGRVANAFEAMAILSIGGGGVLAAAVAGAAGWRVVFVGAGPLLLACLFATRAIEPGAGRPPKPDGGAPAWSGAELRRLLPVYLGSVTLSLTWTGLLATMVPLLGSGHYRLDPAALGLAMSAAYTTELVGLAAVGLVIDRVRREPLFLAGAVTAALGGLILAAGSRPGTFVLGLAFVGAGFAVWMVPATVLADRAGTPLPPAQLATYRIAIDTGMIVGPLLVGGLAELAGARAAVGAAGLVMVGGALVMLRRPAL
jgi:MFS family permease